MKSIVLLFCFAFLSAALPAQERYEVRFENDDRQFAGTLELFEAAATMQLEYFCPQSAAYESIQVDFHVRRDDDSQVELIAYRAVVPGTDVFHPTCPVLDFQLVYDAIGQPHLFLLDDDRNYQRECSIRPLPAPEAIMTGI